MAHFFAPAALCCCNFEPCSKAVVSAWKLRKHKDMLSAANVFSPLQDKGSGKRSLGCQLWPLDKHVDFDHQHAWEKSAAPSAPTLKPKDVKYSVKVHCHCQTW